MFSGKIAIPRLPTGLALTDEDIELALTLPILERERKGEILISPDSEGRPRYANRLLLSALKEWEQRGSMPTATLIKTLLLLFFTGQLCECDPGMQPVRRVVVGSSGDTPSDTLYIDPSEVPDLDDDIDGDYDFSDLR